MNIRLFIAMILCLAAVGCQRGGKAAGGGEMEYAQLLDIEPRDGYTVVRVANPWNPGAVLQTYLLVDRDAPLPAGVAGTVVRTPLRSVVVYSSVHGGAIKELGELPSVTGVCDLQYFDMAEVQQGVEQGRIVDAGNSMQPTLERIVQLHPDAILLSPFQNGGYGALTGLGVPIIECADYMETSPLGRAEWIKLLGQLYGRRAQADSIFAAVVQRYSALKAKADSVEHRPVVLSEMVTSGVWYVPGGDSYMAQLYADAGAVYPWSDTAGTGSLSMSVEQVLERAHDADVWLLKSLQPMNYATMGQQNPIYKQFSAYRDRHIYQCPTLHTTLYRDFPFHPELLLEEYMKIFHPELGLGATRYFQPMGE